MVREEGEHDEERAREERPDRLRQLHRAVDLGFPEFTLLVPTLDSERAIALRSRCQTAQHFAREQPQARTSPLRSSSSRGRDTKAPGRHLRRRQTTIRLRRALREPEPTKSLYGHTRTDPGDGACGLGSRTPPRGRPPRRRRLPPPDVGLVQSRRHGQPTSAFRVSTRAPKHRPGSGLARRSRSPAPGPVPNSRMCVESKHGSRLTDERILPASQVKTQNRRSSADARNALTPARLYGDAVREQGRRGQVRQALSDRLVRLKSGR